MGVAADGIADAHIVAVAAAHGVVLTAHGGEAEPGAVVRLLHERRQVALGNQVGLVEGVGFVVAPGSLEEGLESFRTQVGSGRRCGNKLADGGQTALRPIVVPGIDALLLTVERHQQLVGGRIALYQSQALQGVELMAQHAEVMEGFLHGLALTGEIFGFVAGIGLRAQQVLGMLDHRVVVAQIVHVGIEMGAAHAPGTYANDCQHDDDGNQRLFPIEGIGVDTLNKSRERTLGGP